MRKKQRKSKRNAWDEYIRQIEEMSELDEENEGAGNQGCLSVKIG